MSMVVIKGLLNNYTDYSELLAKLPIRMSFQSILKLIPQRVLKQFLSG